MATIRTQGDVYEIRECVSTEKGPRQRALARFRGVLTAEVLDHAAAAATRPFDRAALIARARERGVPVSLERRHPEARALLARLQSGEPLDPTLVALLREALEPLEDTPVPEHLHEAAEWLGRSETARGKALRGLLRAASRVVRSRGPLREAEQERFPRFSSEAA